LVPFSLIRGRKLAQRVSSTRLQPSSVIAAGPIAEHLTVKNTAASDVAECEITLNGGELRDSDDFRANTIKLDVVRASEALIIPLSSFRDYGRRTRDQFFYVSLRCDDRRWWSSTVYMNEVGVTTQ
jgi:hypothetical protein